MVEFETDASAGVPVQMASTDRLAIDAAVAQVFGLTAKQLTSSTRGQAKAGNESLKLFLSAIHRIFQK